MKPALSAVLQCPPTYTIFRNAILAEQQVICSYGDRHRELCPLIIGTNKNGEEAVLAVARMRKVGCLNL